MFDNVLKFVLLASVTIPNIFNGDPLRVFECKFFYIFSIMLFAASLNSQPQRNTPRTILNIAFALMAVSLFNIITHGISPTVLSHVTLILIFIIDILLIITYCREPEKCFKFVSFGVLANLCVYGIELFYSNPFFIMEHKAPGGLLGSFPRLTIYFALAIPFVFQNSKILTIALLLAASHGYLKPQLTPFIGFALIALFMIKRIETRILLILLLVTVGLFFIDKIMNSIFFRLMTWEDIGGKFMSSSYLITYGSGLGVFRKVSLGEDPQIWSSHLQFIFSTGLTGLVVYFVFIRFYLLNFINNIQNLAVLNIFLVSVIEYPIEIIRYWPTVAFIFGAYFIKTIQERGCKWKPC